MDGPFPGPRLAAEEDAEREPSDLPGLPGWRRPVAGAPHPQDLREIVDAILKVTQPKRILLFGSGARHQMHDDSDIDILVIDEAPRGVLDLKLDIGAGLPDRIRWTDIVVLTPGGVAKRLQWEDETFMQILDEATVLYESEAETRP